MLFKHCQSLTLIAALTLLPASTSAQTITPPATGQRWAMLVGVNDYVTMRKLNHCVDDMQALRDQLVQSGFAEDHVYLLCDQASDAARLPTKRNIEKRLDLLLSLVKDGDVLLIAFGGHGIWLNGKTYLCPSEADGDDHEATMVCLEDYIYHKLERSRASLRLLLVDACRDVPQRGRSGGKDTNDSFIRGLERPPEGVLVFNSCSPGQRAQEDSKLRHGVFTHFLLQGLKGDADRDEDQRVTLGELSKYVGERTQKYVADKFNDFQVPKLSGDFAAATLEYPLTSILAPPVARAPFDAATARKYQEAAAKFIGQPVEITGPLGLRMVLVPPGTFEMGGDESPEAVVRQFPDEDTASFENEHPRHTVEMKRAFYMTRHEITVEQFRQFANASRFRTDAEKGTDSNNPTGAADKEADGKTWKQFSDPEDASCQ